MEKMGFLEGESDSGRASAYFQAAYTCRQYEGYPKCYYTPGPLTLHYKVISHISQTKQDSPKMQNRLDLDSFVLL